MFRIILSLLLSMTLICFCTDVCFAKGFGGRGFSSLRSKPFFSQRMNPSRQASLRRPQQTHHFWRGALGGLLLGSLLSSLFMGHGMGGFFVSWFLIAIVIALVTTLLRRKKNNYS